MLRLLFSDSSTMPFALNWNRADRATIRRAPGRLPTSDRIGLHIAEPFSGDAGGELLVVDGIVRGMATSGRVRGALPGPGYNVRKDGLEPGDEPLLLGTGMALHRSIHPDRARTFIRHTRSLLAQEEGLDGILVAVRYRGWSQSIGGGEAHYLQQIAYGTRRDRNLTPYLAEGFWITGRDADERVAFLARRTG